MKTLVSSFALSFALLAATGASAQYRSAGSSAAADSVLLSETTDGDYRVRRYVIHNSGDSGYTVRYQINMAQLAPSLDNNTHQLDRLGSFVDQLMRDSLMHIKRVTVVGYSSPDGPVAFNEALANKRAHDFKQYLDRQYDFSNHYDVGLRAVAEDWEMCRALVVQSDVPNKQAVLDVIDSSRAIEAKEQALKQMPAAWNYMKKNILPPLRRVELSIDYGEGNIVEVRTRIPRPAPEPEPQPKCCCCVVVDDSASGILVELPLVGRDFGEYDRVLRREVREFEQDLRRDGKRMQRFGRKEGRTADRYYGREDREAEKWNRKKGRIDRRMDRIGERAAARTYDELEREMR